MKKVIAAFMTLLMLTFTGCVVHIGPSDSSSQSSSSGKPLTFEIPKSMQEEGYSTENLESLKTLSNLISEHPYIGAENDISVLYSGEQWRNSNGGQYTVFFVVNRTDKTFKNMSFNLTMKVADDTILDGKEIVLTEDDFGELKPYVAKPLYINLDSEHYNYLKNANNSNVKMSMSNFKGDSQ
ncbi:MAG: hypothetical protein ACFWUD_06900 [Thermocaproicibacter melissae]|jgi:hypothetical protein|uniref:hypothetical protein n=1 Tax=Thermocaproicibacter melissae TaxID=2966552 RepID=UPI003A101473